MEFSLVIELKLVVVDTGYFVGLTPAENSQTQIGEVLRKIHIGDEATHTNSKNFKQRSPSSFFMEGRTERMNIRCVCPWFGMNLRTKTKPLIQLWNKEKWDECHKKDLQ